MADTHSRVNLDPWAATWSLLPAATYLSAVAAGTSTSVYQVFLTSIDPEGQVKATVM